LLFIRVHPFDFELSFFTCCSVSLNDDAFLQVSSTIQQQFPKDDEIIVSGFAMPSAGNSPTNSQVIFKPSCLLDVLLMKLVH
jgi:hypothetical protein